MEPVAPEQLATPGHLAPTGRVATEIPEIEGTGEGHESFGSVHPVIMVHR
jgi:hypothetical protein